MSEMRVVLITGASSGLGQATASLLADRGFRVYGTSRKPRSDKAYGFEMLQLDITSDESVNACVQTLVQRAGRLDILINNAGYGLAGAVEETSIQFRRRNRSLRPTSSVQLEWLGRYCPS